MPNGIKFCLLPVTASTLHQHHLVICQVAIALQRKSNKVCRDVAAGPNLSLTTDYMSLSCSLDLVVSNETDAGNTFDCICCFCQLSVHVGSCSIQGI